MSFFRRLTPFVKPKAMTERTKAVWTITSCMTISGFTMTYLCYENEKHNQFVAQRNAEQQIRDGMSNL